MNIRDRYIDKHAMDYIIQAIDTMEEQAIEVKRTVNFSYSTSHDEYERAMLIDDLILLESDITVLKKCSESLIEIGVNDDQG